MLRIIILLFICSIYPLMADVGQERSQSFRVQIFHDYVKVTSPPKYIEKLSVILENNTLVDILGKVVNSKQKVLAHVRIPSQKSRSVQVRVKSTDRLYFVPISPPFQSVELIFSRDAYEIPPKR